MKKVKLKDEAKRQNVPVEAIVSVLESLLSENKIWGVIDEKKEEFVQLEPKEVSNLVTLLSAKSVSVEKLTKKLGLETLMMRQVINKLMRERKIEGAFTWNGVFIPISMMRNQIIDLSEKDGRISIDDISRKLSIPESNIEPIIEELAEEVSTIIAECGHIKLSDMIETTKFSETFLVALTNWLISEGEISGLTNCLTRDQMIKGIAKFTDKQGKERWGTLEQVEEWKRIELGFRYYSHKMESTIDVADDCLKQMKKCCELEIPFYVASEMESTIGVAEECFEQMKKCCELTDKLGRLKTYESERSLTKVMLILTPYGSKERFKEVVVDTITRFGDRLEKLKSFIKGLEAMVKEKDYKCSQCKGTGSSFKWVYIRERGTPVQRVYQSIPCDGCNEKGYISMSVEVQGFLKTFLDRANELSIAIGNFHKLFHDFTP